MVFASNQSGKLKRHVAPSASNSALFVKRQVVPFVPPPACRFAVNCARREAALGRCVLGLVSEDCSTETVNRNIRRPVGKPAQRILETAMGFLKRVFRNVFSDPGAPGQHTTSSFEKLTEEQLEAHLKVARYGEFVLTEAVRPSFDLQVVPSQGYRHDCFVDDDNRTRVPVLMAAATKDELFDTFLDLLDPLGSTVDVVLETSHERQSKGHVDLYREHIDLPVLKSVLYDYEELLLNDGCTGIAVLNPSAPLEVQFDEHKLLIAYGQELAPFETILRERCVPCNDEMKFITEAEHVHSSSDRYHQQFEELKTRLGMDGMFD